MRSKLLSGVLVLMAALWPAAASACDFYLAYGPMGMQTTQLALGGSLLVIPAEGDDGDTGFVPAVDLGARIGERVVVHPVIGYCSQGDVGELVAGGGLGVNFISNDQWSLGLQGHAAWVDFGNASQISFPVMAAATFDVSETARLYANAGLKFVRSSFEFQGISDSETDSNPAVSAGITLPVGSPQLSGGVVIERVDVGEDDTEMDFGFGAGVQFPLGG